MHSSLALASRAADNLGRLFCRRMRLLLRSAAAAVFVLALLAPLLRSAGLVTSAEIVYQLEGLFCHQESNRCLHLDNQLTALCSRCLGGHLGFLAASFLFSARLGLNRRIRSAITVLALAALLDVAFHLAGLYDTPNLYRLASGMLLGTGLGMVVFRFIAGVEACVEC